MQKASSHGTAGTPSPSLVACSSWCPHCQVCSTPANECLCVPGGICLCCLLASLHAWLLVTRLDGARPHTAQAHLIVAPIGCRCGCSAFPVPDSRGDWNGRGHHSRGLWRVVTLHSTVSAVASWCHRACADPKFSSGNEQPSAANHGIHNVCSVLEM